MIRKFLQFWWKHTELFHALLFNCVFFFFFVELKAAFQSRDAEVSELKIQIDELQRAASMEDQARDELQAHYQQRLREKQNEVDQFRVWVELKFQKMHNF